MQRCMYCDIHFNLCHNGKSKSFSKECPNKNKTCKLFIAREKIDKIIKERPEELDWASDDELHFVYVYWHSLICFKQKHTRTDYLVKISNYDNSEIIKLRVFYCHNCYKFYANGNLLPEHDVLHQLKHMHLFNMPNSYYEFGDMSPQSILKKHGYNAREGSLPFHRHRILDHVIENGILTPYEIINHLSDLIDWHYWDSKWDNAVSKWQEDMHYVQGLDVVEYSGKFRIIHRPMKK